MQDVTSVLMHKVPSNIDIDHVKNFLLENQVNLSSRFSNCRRHLVAASGVFFFLFYFSTWKEYMNFEFGHFHKSELSARCIWVWKIKVQIWTFCMTFREILKRNLVSQKSQERLSLEMGISIRGRPWSFQDPIARIRLQERWW